MYHTRHKGTYYEAGYKWGNLLFHNGNIIANQSTFSITKERKEFSKACLPIYQKYYPEILEEIRGIADGQRRSFEDLFTFLSSIFREIQQLIPIIFILFFLAISSVKIVRSTENFSWIGRGSCESLDFQNH